MLSPLRRIRPKQNRWTTSAYTHLGDEIQYKEKVVRKWAHLKISCSSFWHWLLQHHPKPNSCTHQSPVRHKIYIEWIYIYSLIFIKDAWNADILFNTSIILRWQGLSNPHRAQKLTFEQINIYSLGIMKDARK